MSLICVLINSGAFVVGHPSQGILDAIPLPLVRIWEFFTGVGLGNYFSRWTKFKARSQPIIFGRFGLWTYGGMVATLGLLCLPANRLTSLVVLTFSAWIFGLASERTIPARILSTKTMILGGGISYSMYLVQEPVKELTKMVADHAHIGSAGFRLGMMVILLLAIATIMFKGIEGPVRKALRGGFARLEARRQIKA
jgi:peptidoglycan/LPS O-acetylase OafA/YrhL